MRQRCSKLWVPRSFQFSHACYFRNWDSEDWDDLYKALEGIQEEDLVPFLLFFAKNNFTIFVVFMTCKTCFSSVSYLKCGDQGVHADHYNLMLRPQTRSPLTVCWLNNALFLKENTKETPEPFWFDCASKLNNASLECQCDHIVPFILFA